MQAAYVTSRGFNQPQGIAGFSYKQPITYAAAAGGPSGGGSGTDYGTDGMGLVLRMLMNQKRRRTWR